MMISIINNCCCMMKVFMADLNCMLNALALSSHVIKARKRHYMLKNTMLSLLQYCVNSYLTLVKRLTKVNSITIML